MKFIGSERKETIKNQNNVHFNSLVHFTELLFVRDLSCQRKYRKVGILEDAWPLVPKSSHVEICINLIVSIQINNIVTNFPRVEDNVF